MWNDKECGAAAKNSPGEFGRGQKEGGDTSLHIVLPTSQNPSHWNPSWLRDVFATRKDPKSDQIWEDKHGLRDIRSLNINARLEIAKTLRYSYGSTVKQISRLLHLEKNSLEGFV